ncbi:hypothetical protein HDU98_003948 [Podochytrium sp. JEL0797]|nr:hypothetical protein HDU98_003948 [Podochytrium sp. JEL0797]
MPEVWANLLYIIVPMPLPLSSILILVVDLGFELFIALTYAYDVSENAAGLMKLPPRKPVTPQSIERLYRRRALDQAEHGGDVTNVHEEENTSEVSKFTKFTRGVKKLFTKRYWTEMFEKTEDDILIDGDVLSYAYLEAGTLETIGCLTCFFFAMWYHRSITPYEAVHFGQNWGLSGNDYVFQGRSVTVDDQTEALSFGQSAYYLAIMFQQCFNHFICKARLSNPWGSFMFANKWSFVGILVGGTFSLLIVYIPGVNVAFLTTWRLSPVVWAIAMSFGLLLYGYAVARIIIKRRLSPIKYTDDIPGLQMFPTRWSTRGD